MNPLHKRQPRVTPADIREFLSEEIESESPTPKGRGRCLNEVEIDFGRSGTVPPNYTGRSKAFIFEHTQGCEKCHDIFHEWNLEAFYTAWLHSESIPTDVEIEDPRMLEVDAA